MLVFDIKLVFDDFDSSYEELLQRSNLPTLHMHRFRTMAVEVMKIFNKMSPAYIQDLIQYKVTKYSSRFHSLVNAPKVNTSTYGKASFNYEVARVWNSLPN